LARNIAEWVDKAMREGKGAVNLSEEGGGMKGAGEVEDLDLEADLLGDQAKGGEESGGEEEVKSPHDRRVNEEQSRDATGGGDECKVM
jgi:hypothetical protein